MNPNLTALNGELDRVPRSSRRKFLVQAASLAGLAITGTAHAYDLARIKTFVANSPVIRKVLEFLRGLINLALDDTGKPAGDQLAGATTQTEQRQNEDGEQVYFGANGAPLQKNNFRIDSERAFRFQSNPSGVGNQTYGSLARPNTSYSTDGRLRAPEVDGYAHLQQRFGAQNIVPTGAWASTKKLSQRSMEHQLIQAGLDPKHWIPVQARGWNWSASRPEAENATVILAARNGSQERALVPILV